MKRTRVSAVVAAALAIISGLPIASRGFSADEKPAANLEAAPPKVRGRVPSYFTKLDLTNDQKTRIYTVQNQYDGRIDSLKKQIEELETQRDSEVESILSAGQRSELKKLREEGDRQREEKRKEAESPKKTPPKK